MSEPRCGDVTCPCQDGLVCNYEDVTLPDGSVSPAMVREEEGLPPWVSSTR